MTGKRSKFSGKIGFVLAAAGSAVGLGNIWRFPYLAAKYGGGIFLLVYIILAVTFGFSLMVAEIALGRKTGLSPLGAFRELNKKYAFVGVLASIIPIIIVPYYSVIGGWVLKYLVSYIIGTHSAISGDGYFSGFIAQPIAPTIYQIIFVLAGAVVIIRGVEKGIERVSKVLMPVLLILSVVIAVFACTRPGAAEGIKFYLIPNFKNFSVQTIVGAMGQLFYSMSLAMGIMITYGSYLKKEDDLEKSVGQIEVFDTLIAVLAGLMIIPGVFAFGGGNVNQGPGLMFNTLPKVFEAMGASTFIGILFFLLVLFAALTSSISLMEAITASFCDRFGIGRIKSACITTAIAIILGLPASLGYSVWSDFTIIGMPILDFMDFLSNSLLMPICAFFTCIFVGWVIRPQTIIDEVRYSSAFHREKLFKVMIKYVCPVFMVIILVSSVLNAFNIFSI
jgi:NSS family neurotransmitter:Na+ symporter